MPVPSFLSNIADKAQATLNASPLAGHLPASLHGRAGSPDPAAQPSANQAAAQGGAKNHTLENIQHQFRSLQQQYVYVFFCLLLHICQPLVQIQYFSHPEDRYIREGRSHRL
jgi:hypothetical protein